MKKILLIANHPKYVFNLRKELVEALLKKDYTVGICCPYGKEIDYFTELGCQFFDSNLNRHGKSLPEELKLKSEYGKVMDEFQPDVNLLYTIKPNIYAGLEASKRGIPSIANITGLGSPFQNNNLLKKVLILMYRRTFKKIDTVVFQNEENQHFFVKNKIKTNHEILLPGSGVNLKTFNYLDYPNNDKIKFIFISRIMKEKGIDEYLFSAEEIMREVDNVEFHIAGFIDGDYEEIIRLKESENILQYHGMVDNVQLLLQEMDCLVLPSYHEGMSNVLLEAGASGRGVIATNIAGCREIIDHNVTGLLCRPRDKESLKNAILHYLKLGYSERQTMGKEARKKISQDFDRQIIVKKYIERIEELCHERIIPTNC